MRTFLGNLWYFTSRLTGYGLLLGAVFGTFTYPLVGTMVGLPWGGLAGLLLGLGLGTGVTVYNHVFVRPGTDAKTYQENLTYGIGLVTLLLTALPLLVIFAPVAALTAAHVAHRYAEDRSPQAVGKRKHQHLLFGLRRRQVLGQMVRRTLFRAPPVMALGAIVGMALNVWNLTHSYWRTSTVPEAILSSIPIGIGIVIYGAVIAVMVGLVNGLLVNFLNYIHFAPDMPKRAYKRQVVALVTGLTLVMTLVATGFIGAPFAAIVAGLAAASYANWYYEDTEKAKRDDQHSLLEENYDENYDEEPLVIVDEVPEDWRLFEKQ